MIFKALIGFRSIIYYELIFAIWLVIYTF